MVCAGVSASESSADAEEAERAERNGICEQLLPMTVHLDCTPDVIHRH